MIGSLEPGRRADLFLLNLRLPWLNPIRPDNIVSNIMYNANGSDVTDVLVAGRVVVADGRCVTVPEEQAFRECQRVATGVWERARSLFSS